MFRENPPRVAVPSDAGVYDAALGGSNNRAVDRSALRDVSSDLASDAVTVRNNRAWLLRAIRFLANHAGIKQFLDLGTGMPTESNPHQVAQRLHSDVAVVYVDNDPEVAAAHASYEHNDLTRFVVADLTKPDEVLADRVVSRFFDFSEPIALIQSATLHRYPDTAALTAIMRVYADALAQGSFIALSHFHDPGGADTSLVEQVQDRLSTSSVGPRYFRTSAEITDLFGGFELVAPGLVPADSWWPDGPHTLPLSSEQRLLVAGLARKP